jgi:hypothetical protein
MRKFKVTRVVEGFRDMTPSSWLKTPKKKKKDKVDKFANFDYNSQFPDTAKGAWAALTKIASKEWLDKLDRKAIYMDPEVHGVWGIDMVNKKTGKKGMVVVYLKGYKEPFGDLRKYNDFEYEPDLDDDV